MELVIALAIIGVGLIWYYNSKSRTTPTNTKQNQDDLAPYKVETPVVTPIMIPPEQSKPADDRVEAPAAQVDASANWPFPQAQPVEAKPEKKKAAPRAKKPAEVNKAAAPKKVQAKPAAMTPAAKKPKAKKPAAK